MKKLLLLTLILISGGVLYSQTLPTPYGNTQLKMANGDTTWIATLSQLTGFFGSGGTVTQISTGTGLTGGPITTTGTIQVSTNGIANNMLRQSVGLSVIGRSPNTTGDVADITAGSDKQVLRRDGTSIGFGAIDIASSNAVTGVLPVANGGTGQTTAAAARNALDGFTTTPTAGGTTTLIATSTYNQVFTGTQNQTITLPATSALSTGGGYLIVNNSTGTLTVQTSVSATLGTIPSGTSARVMVLNTTTNLVADWEFAYAEFMSLTGTGSTVVIQSSPRIINPTLAGVTYSTATTHIAGTSNQGSGAMPDSVVINVTSVGANNPGGVTLPATSTGKKVVVINSTAASQGVNVFPASGSTIDLLGSNQPINIPSRGIIEFVAISSTQWISSVKQVTDLSFTTGTLPISKGGTGLTSIGAGNANAILSSNSAEDELSYRKIGIENDISQNPRYRIETDSFVLNLPDATTLVRGLVNIGDQTFTGNKTLTGFLSVTRGLTTKDTLNSAALTINGSLRNKVTTLTASTILDLSHNTINVNNSSQITLTLPTCNGVVLGLTYTIYKISSNTQATVISTASGDTFVGGSTSKFLINQGTDATCTCNGANLWTYSSL